MKQDLTEMELNTLEDMTHDDFYEDGVDSCLWADSFLDFSRYDSKITRGVLASLIKKGIIYPIIRGNYGVIHFTPYGKQVMLELGF